MTQKTLFKTTAIGFTTIATGEKSVFNSECRVEDLQPTNTVRGSSDEY